MPDFSINFFVILINFHFAQASMIIKVDIKVKKRIYLNEYYSIIYLVSESGIIVSIILRKRVPRSQAGL